MAAVKRHLHHVRPSWQAPTTKFTIHCTDGVELHGDTSIGQEFKIKDGVLTFFDAPEGDLQSAVSYSPSAWVSVTHIVEGKGAAAFF